ncbi:MAG: hypothetical protein JSV62_14940 [Promethearchaeota archaeon]|nr:MAG: hypothetical protein JSV62_14940 [Candidatus Lokiarchaeota archaeon]
MKKSTRIILIVVAACIITGGTAFGVLIVTTWGEFNYENTYYYRPSAPSPIEQINIDCDIGVVLINYNRTPTDYYAKMDLDINIAGILVKGASFSDFFNPILWNNNSSPVTTFTLDAKATTWFIFGIFQHIYINLTLRTDIIYDINCYTATGDIFMEVPDNTMINNTNLITSTGLVSLATAKNITFQGNVGLSSSTGDVAIIARQVDFNMDVFATTATGELTLNFSNCIIREDFVGTVSTGDIFFSSYNMKYSTDYQWYLQTSTGDIFTTILQYSETVANVTGTMITSTGSINIYYKDTLSSVGSIFTGSTSTGSITYIPIGTGGFSEIGINPKTVVSNDYSSAINKYEFSLATSTGNIIISAESL